MSRAAVAGGTAVPVVWSFFGYSVPAGPMIVGLLACLMVRLFITLDTPGPKRWVVDGLVTGLAMLCTAVWMVEQQVNLFAAFGTGGGLGAIGAGITTLFKRRGQSAIDALDALAGGHKPPPDMGETLRRIDKADQPPGLADCSSKVTASRQALIAVIRPLSSAIVRPSRAARSA